MSTSNSQQITNQPIKTIECRRIFNLIQQNTSTPGRILTQNNIQQFIKFLTPQYQQKAIQLRQLLGQQLTIQRFANKLVGQTQTIQLTNQQSLRQYYHHIKSILLSNHIKERQLFQQWDRQQTVMNNENVEKIKQNIQQFMSRLLPYLDGMEIFTFQNSLQQINYCLSAITLPNMNEDDIIKIYKQLVNATVLNHVSQFLTGLGQVLKQPTTNFPTDILQQSQNITNYISLICYLYTASSIKPLRQKLSTQSCLFYTQTYPIIITSVNIPQQRIKKQSVICLALMTKYDSKFIQWLISGNSGMGIESNLVKMINMFLTLSDTQGLWYATICLKHVIRAVNGVKLLYGGDNHIGNSNAMISNIESSMITLPLQPLTNITEPILEFAFKTLKTAQILQTQQQSLYLISEILKTHPITYTQLQQIKLTTKVYKASLNLQQFLIPPTLMILQNSIIYDKIDIVQITIHDHGFIQCMQQNIQNKQSPYYYQLVNILYLLSAKYPKFICQKINILQKVINMLINDPNPCITSITSQILLNIINYSIQSSQPILELLYDKYNLFDKILPLMIKKCFYPNDFIILELIPNNQQQHISYNYFDKSMLMTVFEILYVLAVAIPRRHKRCSFNKKLNEQIIRSMSNILSDLFKSDNRPLMQLILRQKIFITAKKLKSQNGITFYKLVNILFQQMTYGMQHRPIQFLRMINQQKKNYSTALLMSQFFTIHELQIQNIPIYLNLQLTFQSTTINRNIPHKFELASIKCYIKQFISKIAEIKQQQIKDIVLRHVDTMRVIENQVQYRSIVNKSIQNRVILLRFEVIDVKIKPRRDQMASMSYINLSGEGGLSRSTIRDNRQNSFIGRQLSRGTSIMGQSTVSRFTPLSQQPSQFSQQRKSYYSPINFNYSNYREKSPVFGGSGGGNRNK